jgi:hypothetical protein
MASPQDYAENDPRHHMSKIKAMLDEVASHARSDIAKMNDPRAQALFETTAEVLGGLAKAYEHAALKSEPAWR